MPVKELRVDLDPEDQAPHIRAKREILSKVIQGNWNTFYKGQGIEFAGFRAYTYEDDASQIDWKATLRSDRTLVREYEEYKTLNVYILLDVSDTMLFSSGEKFKAEHGAELAFSLIDSIQKAGDAVGMSMFTDRLVVDIPPNIGTGFTARFRKELTDPNNYGGPTDIKNVLRFVNASAKEPALIILISDFIGLEPGWERYLDIISQRMEIIGIMVRDPRDKDFPSIGGQFMLQNPTTGHAMLVDTKHFQEEFQREVKKEEDIIAAAFAKTNSGFVEVITGEDIYEPILNFFYRRRNVQER